MRKSITIAILALWSHLLFLSFASYSQNLKTKNKSINGVNKDVRIKSQQQLQIDKNVTTQRDSILRVTNKLNSLRADLEKKEIEIRKNSKDRDALTEKRFQNGISAEERVKANELYSKNREEFTSLYQEIKALKSEIAEVEKIKSATEKELQNYQAELSKVNNQSKDIILPKASNKTP